MKHNSHSYDMTTAKFHRTAVQVPEAQSRIAAQVSAGRIEHVPLADSHGRTLATSIEAPHAYPFSADQVWMVLRFKVQIRLRPQVIIKCGFALLMKSRADIHQNIILHLERLQES